jgi:GNAT superfamily N-acetyltransferase
MPAAGPPLKTWIASMIEIIDYTDRYAADFKRLNLEWLDQFGLTESHDLAMLNDPRGIILDAGGAIYLARSGDAIVGSAALLREHDGVYELAKMGVAPAWQGKGISKLLIEKCLAKAKGLQATKIILFSNHQLQPALALYTRYGFMPVAVTDSPFTTADVKMELVLGG